MRNDKWFFVVAILLVILSGCVKNEETTVQELSSKVVVNETDAIVTIEGHPFLEEDLDFYTFMQKVKNEVNRVKDAESLTGAGLEDSNQYWEEQNKQYENINVQLQDLIELHAMSLLAKEKNYFVPVDKLDDEIKRFNAAVADIPSVQEMIQQYGEEDFKFKLRGYMEESMLRDRIVDDVEKSTREENAGASEQEVKFLAKKYYEDLYQDHVSKLELEINLK